jgi:hypothetical protein
LDAPAIAAPASADPRGRVERHCARQGRLEVDGLAADHAGWARGVGDDATRVQLAHRQFASIDRQGRRGLPRQKCERFGEQTVAGEDGHAFAEDDVSRRSPAPQRVVVHGREIVVDERVGVDQFDGARGRQRQRHRGVSIETGSLGDGLR